MYNLQSQGAQTQVHKETIKTKFVLRLLDAMFKNVLQKITINNHSK